MNCSNGHLSSTADYCSVCGVKLSADPAPATAGHPDKSQSVACPKCQTTQLDSNAQFCENCGHKLNEVPAANPAAPVPVLSSTQPLPTQETPEQPGGDPSAGNWRIECRVFQDAAPDQTTPRAAYESATEIFLTNQVTLIGRSSQKRNLHPEIACDWDDAVSHRHAKIELDPEGNALLVDVGSTNGTMLNGELLAANTSVKLKDGDRISLGGKTALIVHGPGGTDVKGER
jgi:hypothetical protein